MSGTNGDNERVIFRVLPDGSREVVKKLEPRIAVEAGRKIAIQ